jgi:pterin-4a-carbinolamine dehydratase
MMIMNSEDSKSSELDPSEIHQLEKQLKDWTFAGQHHMHKSWHFSSAQQALKWHGLARGLSERHSGDCYFYLGHVGNGRIETDILNHRQGHLTRDDLDVAMIMNKLEHDVRNSDSGAHP